MELRRNLRGIGNVPVMYFGPDQRVTMEDIHRSKLLHLEKEIKNKLLPQEKEMEEIVQLQKAKK